MYEQLKDEGADQILSLHISAKLSNVVNVARMAAEATTSIPITVVDSGQLTIGTGLMASEAAKAAREGASMAELLNAFENKKTRVHTAAALDTLEFLRRSGRLSQFQALMGTFLKIKPILTMHNDLIGMERVRTRQKAIDWLIDYLEKQTSIEQIAIVHTHASENAQAFLQQIRHLLPSGTQPPIVDVTPVLGAHIGPGVVGFTCVTAPGN